MATIDDVGRAQDRCLDHDVPVVMGLGRHTNDLMAEIGWGGLQIDHQGVAVLPFRR